MSNLDQTVVDAAMTLAVIAAFAWIIKAIFESDWLWWD